MYIILYRYNELFEAILNDLKSMIYINWCIIIAIVYNMKVKNIS